MAENFREGLRGQRGGKGSSPLPHVGSTAAGDCKINANTYIRHINKIRRDAKHEPFQDLQDRHFQSQTLTCGSPPVFSIIIFLLNMTNSWDY